MVSTVASASPVLAAYVLRLSNSLASTDHANDRPLYQRLLANAAPLLALVVADGEREQISGAIQRHERLSSELFIAGSEHVAIAEAWRRFKEAYGTPTI